VTGANGVATNYTFPVNGPNFSDVFSAPGAPGTYTVTSTFTPSAGSTLTGSTSGPASLTVGAAAATITETVNPNPATAGSTVTVNGTVTNADGSSGAGTVQLYVRRNTLYDYVAKYAGRGCHTVTCLAVLHHRLSLLTDTIKLLYWHRPALRKYIST